MYYYHRLLRLFTCILPSAPSGLLFGSFARFYHENGMARCSTTSREYAATHGVYPLQRNALCRLHEIWESYIAVKHRVDRRSHVAYMVGIVMDTHMPLATLSTDLSLHVAYLKKLAPEQTAMSKVWCEDSVPNSRHIITQLWSSQFGAHHDSRWARVRPVRVKKKAATKHRTNRVTNTDVLIASSLPTVKATVATLTKNDKNLLDKGLPNPTSIRYIASQLRADMNHRGTLSSIVRHVVYCFVLGAYEAATVIAPPELRHRLYTQTPETDRDLFDDLVFKRLNSRELYSMISEFIVCLSRRNSALYHALQFIPRWDQYESMCMKVCDKILRSRIHAPAATTSAVLSRVYYKQNGIGQLHDQTMHLQSASLMQLCNIMRVRYRIPMHVVDAVGGHARARSLYRMATKAENANRIQMAVLVQMGMSRTSLMAFNRRLKGCDVKHTKRVTRALAQLSPVEVAILHLYLHALTERLRLSVVPMRTDAVDDPTINPVLVCNDCFTVRSKARGLGKLPKGGVLIDIEQSEDVICSGCRSSNLQAVSLQGKWLLAPTSSDSAAFVITICTRCTLPMTTNLESSVGIHHLCRKCLVQTRAEMVPNICFCGDSVLSGYRSIKMFLAYTESNEMGMYAACAQHEHLVPIRDIVPIRVLRAQIRQPSATAPFIPQAKKREDGSKVPQPISK